MAASFIAQLPKIELHAHISGSLRPSTVKELLSSNGHYKSMSAAKMKELIALVIVTDTSCRPSFESSFALFDVLHRVIDSLEIVYRITREVLEDFVYRDQCCYLELRTTPREMGDSSLRDHVRTVLRALEDFKRTCTADHFVDAQIILSVNRSNTIPDSEKYSNDIVDLAIEFKDDGVCGVGFGGNPFHNPFKLFVPAFERAKQAGLGTTIHTAETFNEEDTRTILDFGPGRIGHCCCLSEELDAVVHARSIPIEVCLTSNLVTENVARLEDHPVRRWLARSQPVSVCTDDKGVFNNDLRREYELVTSFYPGQEPPDSMKTRQWLYDLAVAPALYCFAGPETRARIISCFERFRAAAQLPSRPKAAL